MSSDFSKDNKIVDLTDCDREPIHIPGAVQPHGVLIVVSEPDLIIEQISENCGAHFGIGAVELLGKSLSELLAADDLRFLKEKVLPDNLEALPTYLPAIRIGKNDNFFEGLAHRFNGKLIFEFELQTAEARDYNAGSYGQLRAKLNFLDRTKSLKDFCQAAAESVREFTGFDRVMVYRFLDDGAGQVIAEAKSEDLESFLDLHYPASDIPQQARRLFVLNPIRVVPDTSDNRSPMVAFSGSDNEPLDMSYTTIRATSPIHLEYLRNMNVAASMSISIVRDDKLWGLFACHHYEPRYVPHAARMATEFLSHLLSLQVDSKEKSGNFEYITKLKDAREKLIAQTADGNSTLADLLKDQESLLAGINGDGAALILNDELKTTGATPTEEQIRALTGWLWENQKDEVFYSDALAKIFPAAEFFRDCASGLLAVRLTSHKPEYLLWFRCEYRQSIKWAGDPAKSVSIEENGERLSPRKSFAAWNESVTGKSKPWLDFEIEHAQALRRTFIEIIIRRAEELRILNEELERSNVELDSFAYVASHDLKEPLRGIHNYSHFLLEDYADKLDEEGKDQLRTLIKLTDRMESLLDTLLGYSRLGRTDLNLRDADLNEVLRDALTLLRGRIEETKAEIRVPRLLPTVKADDARLGEVFRNLIANALKYNDKPNKFVEIGYDKNAGEYIFYVRDNGIGIDERNYEKIFRIFKRLHGRDAFGGGVGAGLTIAQKIVERHGGRLWLESKSGEGTTFYFTLDNAKRLVNE